MLQLLLYREDLDNPPVLVACDIENYEVHIAFTGFKTRVEKFTNAGRYSDAVKEWKQFGENFSAPELMSKIDQQVREINRMAVEAAEKAVADAGSGADARSKLEEAARNLEGTDGRAIINKALRGLK